jgi:hypothetical protein
MGRRTQTIPKSKSNKSNKPSTYTPRSTSTSHTKQETSNGMLGMIGQGISLGAGAAIGSSAINGVMDSFSTEESNQQSNYCINVKKTYQECLEKGSNEEWNIHNDKCSILIKNFKECFNSHRF